MPGMSRDNTVGPQGTCSIIAPTLRRAIGLEWARWWTSAATGARAV